MTTEWKNEPMTPEEEASWDEHEAYILAQGQHDRAAYFDEQAAKERKQKAHELNRAICIALANQPSWKD